MRFCLAFLFLLYGLSAFGQGENNVWAFGFKGGLDFNGSAVAAYRTEIGGIGFFNNMEACAAVSDATGQLLFYTDGSRVWDRMHNLMLGGGTLHGWPLSYVTESAQHGAQIVPVIGEEGKYYIFSLTEFERHATGNGGHLFYSVVDMSLNGGLGDIDLTRKWVFLDSNLTEKMIAVPGNNCNIWLLVHDLDTNLFKAYEISAGGINDTPVPSYTGVMGSLPGTAGNTTTFRNRWWVVGQMTVSPDRTRIAAAYLAAAHAEVFDFDPSTGQVSNAFVLDTMLQLTQGNSFSGVAFSGDNSKLYVSGIREVNNTGTDSRYIYQYDMLAAGGTAGIRASKTLVGNCGINSHLRRGPDGKIYFLYTRQTDSLGVIEAPDLPVPACQYRARALVLLPGSYSTFTLGNNYVMPIVTKFRSHSREVVLCEADSAVLTADPAAQGYLWEDGSTGISRTVYAPGMYTVEYYDECHRPYTDTIIVRIQRNPLAGPDGYSCPEHADGILWMTPSDTTTYTYTWTDGGGIILRETESRDGDTLNDLKPGGYRVWVRAPGGCDTVYVLWVLPHPAADASFFTEGLVCKGESLLFESADSSVTWQWVFGDGQSETGREDVSHTYNYTGEYRVSLSVENSYGCRDTTTQTVRVVDFSLDLSASSALVNHGETIYLETSSEKPYRVIAWRPGHLFADQTAYAQSRAADTTCKYIVVGISEAGCKDSAEVEVRVVPVLFIPSAFSPDGDGLNDYFRPASTGVPPLVRQFLIYNRWGKLVWEASGTTAVRGWDGRYSDGTPAEAGVYFYTIDMETMTGRADYRKGDVTLVR